MSGVASGICAPGQGRLMTIQPFRLLDTFAEAVPEGVPSTRRAPDLSVSIRRLRKSYAGRTTSCGALISTSMPASLSRLSAAAAAAKALC